MKSKSLVALTVLLLSGTAFAKPQEIAAVQVRPQAHQALDFDCASSARPSAADVERLLSINDRSQTAGLRTQLMGAVGEACVAGVANIVVQRAASGESVTWRPARGEDASIALALN